MASVGVGLGLPWATFGFADNRQRPSQLSELVLMIGVNCDGSTNRTTALGEGLWISRNIALRGRVTIAFHNCARRLCTRLSQRAD